ncbi:hypothetical protein CHUAL_000282 [Chamberlinius hualienensis]
MVKEIDQTDSVPTANGTEDDSVYTVIDSSPALEPPEWSPEHYDVNHKYMAKYFIFNHTNFEDRDLSFRNGTNADVESLKNVFKNLNCVPGTKKENYNNLKVKKIREKLKKISESNYSDCSAVIIAVLSHGDEGIIHAYDKSYKIRELWEPFTRSDSTKTLIGKPKIFIIQACQGDKPDYGREPTETDSAKLPDSDDSVKIPTFADYLFLYSSPPGYCSFRGSSGSWMIQTLCAGLNDFKDQLDLQSIITLVKREIAINKESYNPHNPSIDQKKQIPFEASTLTKKFYLTTTCLKQYPCWTDEGKKLMVDQNMIRQTSAKRKISTYYKDNVNEPSSNETMNSDESNNTESKSTIQMAMFGTTLAAGVLIGVLVNKLL